MRFEVVTLIRRLSKRLERSGDCWLWTGAKSTAGYGQMRVDRKSVYTHRLMYEAMNGPIPDKMYICHRCDQPACCNPSHLFLGTAQDNSDDMVAKGRYGGKRNLPIGSAIKSSKLREDQVAEIKLALKHHMSQPKLARHFGVSVVTINNIANGKIWRHVQ